MYFNEIVVQLESYDESRSHIEWVSADHEVNAIMKVMDLYCNKEPLRTDGFSKITVTGAYGKFVQELD